MNHAGKDGKLLEEFGRNSLKAKDLITAKDGEKSPYQAATEIVDAKSTETWWKY